MTKYGKEMMGSTRRPPVGGAWIVFVVAAVLAVALAIIAQLSEPSSNSGGLWIAALIFGTVSIAAWYALAVNWARRRKRLWG